MATFERASELANDRPEITLPEANGPRPRWARSTPSTRKETGAGRGAPELISAEDGMVSLVSVRGSPPAAAATPCSLDTDATADGPSRPSRGRARQTCACALAAALNRCFGPEPPWPVGALVTVTSVPIP